MVFDIMIPMRYDKLVRDRLPEIIEKEGNTPVTHIADDEEYWQRLKEKLKEEVNEFLEESNKEELVDILEVICAIREFKEISKEKLELLRKEKAKRRGGFKNRIILEEVR